MEPPSGVPGEDVIAAVRRGPDSVFVHWECCGARSAEVLRELGDGATWVLRVLNVVDGTSRRIPVVLDAGGHYVPVSPRQRYGFELAATAQGKWRTVCRTGRVEIPPAPPSEVADSQQPAFGRGVPGLHVDTTPLPGGSSPGHVRP